MTLQSTRLYHLLLLQDRWTTQLDRELVPQVEAYLEAKIATAPEDTHIDVWLESPGGDTHAAYKTALALRHRCSKLRVIVPDLAKSAATLLAIAADEIFMAPTAELGPLDTQVGHPDREETTISALDIADSLETLTKVAIDVGMLGAITMTHNGAKRTEAMKVGLDFAAEFLRPILGKLDPHLLHKARNQLRIAEDYAVRMLQLRRVPDVFALAEAEARELVQRLIKTYPAHGFIISRDEAADLGLPVLPAESHPRWQPIKRLHAQFLRDQTNRLTVLSDEELDPRDSRDEEQVQPTQAETLPEEAHMGL